MKVTTRAKAGKPAAKASQAAPPALQAVEQPHLTTSNLCGSSGNACSVCSNSTCQSGLCTGPGAGGGSSGAGGVATGGGGGTSSAAPACNVAEDCPYWYCECRTGPPVNSRSCVNNRCQDGAQYCPTSCANFGTCWTGLSSGGYQGGSNAGPSTCGGGGGGTGGGATGGGGGQSSCPYRDLGKGCASNSDCASGKCFGTAPSFVCTMSCSTANDCPLHWTCQPATTGGGICMIGATSGTPSTSTACFGNTFSDLGASCAGACQSGFCTASVCTRRCDGEFDCPSSWTCVTGASFKYCAP